MHRIRAVMVVLLCILLALFSVAPVLMPELAIAGSPGVLLALPLLVLPLVGIGILGSQRLCSEFTTLRSATRHYRIRTTVPARLAGALRELLSDVDRTWRNIVALTGSRRLNPMEGNLGHLT